MPTAPKATIAVIGGTGLRNSFLKYLAIRYNRNTVEEVADGNQDERTNH
jgi:hypothetical protein